MTAIAENYIAALVQGGNVKDYYSHGKTSHLFRSDGDKKLFEFFDHHLSQFGVLPHPDTVEQHTGVTLPVPKEPAAFYLEQLRQSYIKGGIVDAAKAAEPHLSPDSFDPYKALGLLTGKISELNYQQVQQTVLDYREAGPMIKTAYNANALSFDNELKFGWPTLDKQTGGITDGDVISIFANSGIGKTWLLLRMAQQAWRQGRVPIFVSMEIKPLPIMQRIAALDTGKSTPGIKLGQLSTPTKKKFFAELDALPDSPLPFYVVDGNLQSTAHDINALVKQIKPGLLLIDGAYLMKHPTEKDRFRRIAENVDLIKQDLAATCPVVASWQTNREGKKLKPGQKPGMEHIAGSDAIGTHSSVVLRVDEDESVETGSGRLVDVLKGRHGETGSFRIRWEFDGLTDLSEVEEDAFSILGQ